MGNSSHRHARPQNLLQTAVDNRVAPGLLALSFDSKTFTASAAAGLHDLEAQTPIDLGSTVWLASMSKIAVSLAALVIVEKHNISLDSNESLAAVLPELKLGSGGPCDTIFDGRDDEDKWKFKPATVGVTLRHLLTHTAGFGYFFASPEDASLREPNGTFPSVLSGAEVAFATPRIFEAGERFLYGSSTDWVARFVERVSGTPLRTALVSLVFEPLGVPAGELDPFRTPQLDQKRGTINAKVAPATFVPIPFDTPQFEQPPPGFAALGSACLWGTLSAWATFLQCLLRKAAPADGGPALISEVLWDEAVSNSLKHYGLKLPAPLLETVDPELCCTVAEYSRPASEVARTASPDGFTMLSTVLHTTKTATGKSPGAHGWAGLSNSFFFIDAEAGVGGVLLAQFFPFGDEGMLKLRDEFESAVYEEAARTRAAVGA